MQIPVTTSGRIHPYHPNMRPRLSFRDPRRTGSNRSFRISFGQPLLFLITLSVSAQDVSDSHESWGTDASAAIGCRKKICNGRACLVMKDPCPIFLELTAVARQWTEDPCGRQSAQHFRHAQFHPVCRVTMREHVEGTGHPLAEAAAIEQLQFLDSDARMGRRRNASILCRAIRLF